MKRPGETLLFFHVCPIQERKDCCCCCYKIHCINGLSFQFHFKMVPILLPQFLVTSRCTSHSLPCGTGMLVGNLVTEHVSPSNLI